MAAGGTGRTAYASEYHYYNAWTVVAFSTQQPLKSARTASCCCSAHLSHLLAFGHGHAFPAGGAKGTGGRAAGDVEHQPSILCSTLARFGYLGQAHKHLAARAADRRLEHAKSRLSWYRRSFSSANILGRRGALSLTSRGVGVPFTYLPQFWRWTCSILSIKT